MSSLTPQEEELAKRIGLKPEYEDSPELWRALIAKGYTPRTYTDETGDVVSTWERPKSNVTIWPGVIVVLGILAFVLVLVKV